MRWLELQILNFNNMNIFFLQKNLRFLHHEKDRMDTLTPHNVALKKNNNSAEIYNNIGLLYKDTGDKISIFSKIDIYRL